MDEEVAKIPQQLGCVFAGAGGVFERSVDLSLQQWDASTPFVVLDVGCGGGQSQIPLLQLLIQMGLEALKRSAAQWLDDSVEAFFISQSFYEAYDFSCAVRTDGKDGQVSHGDVKVNLLFSQSALHWVPELQPLTMEYMRSQEAREYSKTTMRRILDNMLACLCPGGIATVHHLGIVQRPAGGEKGWEGVQNTVDSYTHAFRNAFDVREDCELMLSQFLPQCPRILEDIRAELLSECRRGDVALLECGELDGAVQMPKMTPELAQALSKRMVGLSVWRDRFRKLFPLLSEQQCFERAETALAGRLLEVGLFSNYTIVFYVLQKK